MARGGPRSTEHDDADRRTFAVLLIGLGLLGSMLALAHRQQLEHGSAPGDACPVTAHGGLAGLDATTGEVRWTTIVPNEGGLFLDEGSDEVHHIRAASDADDPDGSIVVDRVVDPTTGRITACTSERSDEPTAFHNRRAYGDTHPVEPPLVDGDVTVMPWGSGLRATDETNTGLWALEQARAEYRVGRDLIVDEYTADGMGNRTTRLDVRTGEPRWTVDGRLANRGPGIGTVVVSRASDPGELIALDPETGDERWRTDVPFSDGEELDGVVVAYDVGRLVIVPNGDDGKVAALDAETGEVIWTATAGTPGRSPTWSLPGDAHSAVLSPDGETVIVAVDAWMAEKYD